MTDETETSVETEDSVKDHVTDVTDDTDDFDKPRALALISKLRDKEREGKQTAQALKEAQARLKEHEDAQKTEAERVLERLAAYEKKEAEWDVRERNYALRDAVFGLASGLGVADADLALAALDRSKVEFEDGRPTNVEEVLTALLEAKPLLKGQPPAQPKAQPANMNAGEGTVTQPGPSLTAEELEIVQQSGGNPDGYAAFKGATSIADMAAARKKAAAAAT